MCDNGDNAEGKSAHAPEFSKLIGAAKKRRKKDNGEVSYGPFGTGWLTRNLKILSAQPPPELRESRESREQEQRFLKRSKSTQALRKALEDYAEDLSVGAGAIFDMIAEAEGRLAEAARARLEPANMDEQKIHKRPKRKARVPVAAAKNVSEPQGGEINASHANERSSQNEMPGG